MAELVSIMIIGLIWLYVKAYNKNYLQRKFKQKW